MFITDVHRGQIRAHLQEMERQFDVLQILKGRSLADFQAQPVLRAAGERALHIALECLTDIGNILIDALIMRDAASYEDIFVILTEEKVFEKSFADHFLPAVRFRKMLVHDYVNLTTELLWEAVQNYADDYATIRDSVAKYVNL